MSAEAGGETAFGCDPRMQAVVAATRAALARLPDPLDAAGRHLLDHLTPPQWTVEWYLPQWLGDAYDLPPAATHALVVANIYGLGYIGLQDALVDGEIDAASRTHKVCLASALYHLWLQHYIDQFPAGSPFWQHYDQFMRQWLLATLHSNQPPASDFSTFLRTSYLQLAWRGAPLKICCAAAQLLARRELDLTPLLAAVDHLLVAAVLLDHERDWQEDLAAKRYNTFVHFACPQFQEMTEPATIRRQVMEQILLRRVTAPYFELVQEQIGLAKAYAQAADCPGLAAHLHHFSREIHIHQVRLAENVAAALYRAGRLVLGPAYPRRKEGMISE